MKRDIYILGYSFLALYSLLFFSCTSQDEINKNKTINQFTSIHQTEKCVDLHELAALIEKNFFDPLFHDKNLYFLLAQLYQEKNGYDKNIISLLKEPLRDTNSLFYSEAFDLYIKTAFQLEKPEWIRKLIQKQGIPLEIPYSKFLNALVSNKIPENLDPIEGKNEFFNGVVYLSLQHIQQWQTLRPMVVSYIISLTSTRQKESPQLNQKLLAILHRQTKSAFLETLLYRLNREDVSYELIKRGLLEADSEKELEFLRKLYIDCGRKTEFRKVLSQSEPKSKQLKFLEIMDQKGSKGYPAIQNSLEELLKEYPYPSEEQFKLLSTQLFHISFHTKGAVKKAIQYSQDYPFRYNSYLILSKMLRQIIKEETGEQFQDQLYQIDLSCFSSNYVSSIVYLLELLFPGETQWKEYLTKHYPLSYGGLREENGKIDWLMQPPKNSLKSLSTNAKKELAKLKYYQNHQMEDKIHSFRPSVLLSPEEQAFLLQEKKEYFMAKEDYYSAIAVAKKIAEILYYDPFAPMDIHTFHQLYPLHYKEIVLKYANRYQLDPAFIWAILREESHYRRDITSSANAVGLMQIMPSTAKWLAPKLGIPLKEIDLTDPDQNIHFGAYYISYIRTKVEETELIAAGYNAGHGRAIRWQHHNTNYPKKNRYELTPIEETRHYIRKVMQSYYSYKIILEEERILSR